MSGNTDFKKKILDKETQEKVRVKRNYKRKKIEVLEVKNFVTKEKGILLKEKAFSTDLKIQDMPKIFMRAIVTERANKKIFSKFGKTIIDVKQTETMGKGVFMEYPISVDGIEYNFLQAKGCLRNYVSDIMIDKSTLKKIFPLGKKGIAPFFVMKNKPWDLVRFLGAAKLEDLLVEEKMHKIVSKTRIRVPSVLITFKFTKEFCKENNLPLPENDNPNDIKGETIESYIKRHKEQINPVEYKRIKNICAVSPDSTEYKSVVLGENIRLFRNVFRVKEVENALKEPNKKEKHKKFLVILNTSKKVFSKEFGQEVDNNELIKKFSFLMGQNVAHMINNKIVQGAMFEHKQDITLAAEVCDWDKSFQLTKEYLNDSRNFPKPPRDWIKDRKDKKEWQKKQHMRMYRQIFLMASNIKPVLEMTRQIGTIEIEEISFTNFIKGITQNLLEEEKNNLFDVLNKNKRGRLQDIKDMAGKIKDGKEQLNPKILKNLEGQQKFFNEIAKHLKEKLSSRFSKKG